MAEISLSNASPKQCQKLQQDIILLSLKILLHASLWRNSM